MPVFILNSCDLNAFGAFVRWPMSPNLVLNTCPMNADTHGEFKCPPVLWGALPNGGGGWTGGGVVGTYYSNTNYTGTSFSRTDVRVDMPPTTVLPGGSLSTDPLFGAVGATNFSVSWSGTLIPRNTDTCTLKIKTGGTLTLKINGSTVASATSSNGWVSFSYAFTAGNTYSVTLSMVHTTGPWCAQLRWYSNGAVPFPEEAIGPVTPVGVSLDYEPVSLANAALGALYYHTVFNGPQGPALDSNGWPTGDFALEVLGGQNDAYNTAAAYPVANSWDNYTGLWSISFGGSAEVYTNGSSQLLIGHDDGGGRTAFTLNGKTYYAYGNDIPLSAQVYDGTTDTGYNGNSNTTKAVFLLRTTDSYEWDNIGFKNTDRSGNGTPAKGGTPAQNGITNLTCMRPTSFNSTTPCPTGTVFHAPYLATAAPYTCLRNLDSSYMLNFDSSVSPPYSDWSRRPTPVFSFAASDVDQYPKFFPAWETKVMMANMTGKDLYLNIPQTATGGDPKVDANYQNSYLYKLASLIKNGNTINGVNYPGLLPHLNVYLEYGNENWNGSLPAVPYGARGGVVHAADSAKQANTTDWQQYTAMGFSYTTDAGGHVTDIKTTPWSALRVKDISDIFRVVYGDDPMPGGPGGRNPDPRVRPIFEWQGGGDWNGEGQDAATVMQTFRDYFGVPINHIFYGAGGAWYSDNRANVATADATYAAWNLSNVAYASGTDGSGRGWTAYAVDRTALFGLKHVGYEGGFDFLTDSNPPSDGAPLAQGDTRIKPFVRQSLDQYYNDGGCLPVVYRALGTAYGYQMQWGVVDGVWSSPPFHTALPKLQAYLDAQNTVPAAQTNGLVVLSTSFSLPYGLGAQHGLSYTQTFRVTSHGNYKIGFHVQVGIYTSSTGTIHVSVDGTEVITYAMTSPTGGDDVWMPVILGVGIHAAKLWITNMQPYDNQHGINFDYWGVKAG